MISSSPNPINTLAIFPPLSFRLAATAILEKPSLCHQPDDASKQADHKDRHQQRAYDPEPNAGQSAQLLGHRLAHEITTPWQAFTWVPSVTGVPQVYAVERPARRPW